MLVPLDYKDLLRILNKHKVRYLIIGAYAVIYYTEPRYTKDLDIWIDSNADNAEKIFAALKEFGVPLKDITTADFTEKALVYQIGVAPVRIDIITGISDMDFSFAWEHRKVVNYEGIRANIIGINELIKTKKDTRREMDKRDIEVLRFRLKGARK